MDKSSSKAGVYLHIPFCKSRCSYCDFATDVYRTSDAVEQYVAALRKEIESFGTTGGNATVKERASTQPTSLVDSNTTSSSAKSTLPAPTTPSVQSGGHPSSGRRGVCVSARTLIDTVYFGGGTPSLLTPHQVEQILTSVRDRFSIAPDAEITMEMNPATVTPESLAAYRSVGVNRASFGVQTFDDTELRRLARGHDAQDARDTFRMLREAGFENISFDLIAGLPRQTLADWERNLNEALAMQPEHLSLYLLEIHEGTPLAEQVRSGRQPRPDEDLAAEMYELMLERIGSAGYEQYEISTFAKPGFESRHNSKYWLLEPVYGFGVSAHSYDGRERYANERDTAAYVRLLEKLGSAEVMREEIDTASEFVFLGLRLNEGIDLADYRRRFGRDLESKYEDEIKRLTDADLLELDSGRLRLTGKGMLFSNEVFEVFV